MVLMVEEILEHGESYIETSPSHQGEQFAVLLLGPAHLPDCADIVTRQFPAKRPGDTFVKQNARGTPGVRSPDPALRPPAHARRWGSGPGTPPACRPQLDSR